MQILTVFKSFDEIVVGKLIPLQKFSNHYSRNCQKNGPLKINNHQKYETMQLSIKINNHQKYETMQLSIKMTNDLLDGRVIALWGCCNGELEIGLLA